MCLLKLGGVNVQVVPEVVGRVHALLAGDWDWSGAGGRGSASEEAREQADLQRSYYGFLNALCQNQLIRSLQVHHAFLVSCSQGEGGGDP